MRIFSNITHYINSIAAKTRYIVDIVGHVRAKARYIVDIDTTPCFVFTLKSHSTIEE